MSKQVVASLEILNADEKTLKNALGNMILFIGAEILDVKNFKTWDSQQIAVKGACVKIAGNLCPLDIYLEKGIIKINGDEMDMARTQGLIKQFYGATFAQQKIMIQLGKKANMQYISKTKRIRLKIAEMV